VARHDWDLSQQMKSASTAPAFSASGGVWAKAGKRRSRLEDAVNSARETKMSVRYKQDSGLSIPGSGFGAGLPSAEPDGDA